MCISPVSEVLFWENLYTTNMKYVCCTEMSAWKCEHIVRIWYIFLFIEQKHHIQSLLFRCHKPFWNALCARRRCCRLPVRTEHHPEPALRHQISGCHELICRWNLMMFLVRRTFCMYKVDNPGILRRVTPLDSPDSCPRGVFVLRLPGSECTWYNDVIIQFRSTFIRR